MSSRYAESKSRRTPRFTSPAFKWLMSTLIASMVNLECSRRRTRKRVEVIVQVAEEVTRLDARRSSLQLASLPHSARRTLCTFLSAFIPLALFGVLHGSLATCLLVQGTPAGLQRPTMQPAKVWIAACETEGIARVQRQNRTLTQSLFAIDWLDRVWSPYATGRCQPGGPSHDS